MFRKSLTISQNLIKNSHQLSLEQNQFKPNNKNRLYCPLDGAWLDHLPLTPPQRPHCSLHKCNHRPRRELHNAGQLGHAPFLLNFLNQLLFRSLFLCRCCQISFKIFSQISGKFPRRSSKIPQTPKDRRSPPQSPPAPPFHTPPHRSHLLAAIGPLGSRRSTKKKFSFSKKQKSQKKPT